MRGVENSQQVVCCVKSKKRRKKKERLVKTLAGRFGVMSRSGRTGRYEGPSADVYEYGALGKHLCFFFKNIY